MGDESGDPWSNQPPLNARGVVFSNSILSDTTYKCYLEKQKSGILPTVRSSPHKEAPVKKIILLVLIGVMVYLAGCAAIETVVKTTRDTVTSIDKNAGLCEENSKWKDNLFVFCPETTAPIPGNITPTQTGK